MLDGKKNELYIFLFFLMLVTFICLCQIFFLFCFYEVVWIVKLMRAQITTGLLEAFCIFIRWTLLCLAVMKIPEALSICCCCWSTLVICALKDLIKQQRVKIVAAAHRDGKLCLRIMRFKTIQLLLSLLEVWSNVAHFLGKK